MYPDVEDRVRRMSAGGGLDCLSGKRIGLEKESLRVDRTGGISQQDHPESLGAALTNRSITTDFSEALLEMVTPPLESAREAVGYLTDLHRFILPRLPDGEHLWNASMPCVLHGDESIRIATYGTSHNAQMKHAYRRGLALRYGKRMQAIAGIHFNYSLPDCAWEFWRRLHDGRGTAIATIGDERDARRLATDGYFHMTRNLLRIGWMVPYLFGASPAVCRTFLDDDHPIDLASIDGGTRYAPHGTSLRMGDIGYQYRQDGAIDLSVRHEHFDAYLDDLFAHVTTEHPPYAALGLEDAEGQRQQLNANRLQIENEYYSSVRPKQIPTPGEMPILALARRGVRYLELRSIDIDLEEPAGIGVQQVAMLELLMLFAWLADSPALGQDEIVLAGRNMRAVAQYGREPDLVLDRCGGETPLRDWGLAIVDALAPLAEALDSREAEPVYAATLAAQRGKLLEPASTPSAMQLEKVRDIGSFFTCVMEVSAAHDEALENEAIATDRLDALEREVRDSFEKRSALEAASSGDFDTFLSDYFAQLDDTDTLPLGSRP